VGVSDWCFRNFILSHILQQLLSRTRLSQDLLLRLNPSPNAT